MVTNTCDMNLKDADTLLPPRKRLLAELKRQNSDVNCHAQSSCSEFDSSIRSLLSSRFINCNISNEEIVEASRTAAIAAAKVAKFARVNAEVKAAKATKAVVAAKRALELVDSLSEAAANKVKAKRNKLKKRANVQALYNKNNENSNGRTDQEFFRELHQVIKGSPRILKNSSGSDTTLQQHKSAAVNGRTRICRGPPIEEDYLTPMAMINTNDEVCGGDIEVPVKEQT